MMEKYFRSWIDRGTCSSLLRGEKKNEKDRSRRGTSIYLLSFVSGIILDSSYTKGSLWFSFSSPEREGSLKKKKKYESRVINRAVHQGVFGSTLWRVGRWIRDEKFCSLSVCKKRIKSTARLSLYVYKKRKHDTPIAYIRTHTYTRAHSHTYTLFNTQVHSYRYREVRSKRGEGKRGGK